MIVILFYCSIVQDFKLPWLSSCFNFNTVLAIPSRRRPAGWLTRTRSRSGCQCIQVVFQLEVAESEFQLECHGHWLSVTVQCVTVQCVTFKLSRSEGDAGGPTETRPGRLLHWHSLEVVFHLEVTPAGPPAPAAGAGSGHWQYPIGQGPAARPWDRG